MIPGAKARDVWPKAWEWWQRAGFAIAQVGPNHFAGSSVYSKIGLRREVELRLQEANDALYVDLAFRARITDEGAVGGAVAAVVFFPIAAVGGALSWSEYENEANQLLTGFWQHLWQVTGRPSQVLFGTAPPFGTPFTATPPPPAQAAVAKPCTKCGAGVLVGWRACPYCGTPAG